MDVVILVLFKLKFSLNKLCRDKTTIGKKLIEADRTGYPIIIVIGTSAILINNI